MIMQPLNPLQRQQIQLSWIIQATHFFITGLKGFCEADLKAGLATAIRAFFSGQSGASAIETGTRHARVLIKRRALQP